MLYLVRITILLVIFLFDFSSLEAAQFDPKFAAQQYIDQHETQCEAVGCVEQYFDISHFLELLVVVIIICFFVVSGFSHFIENLTYKISKRFSWRIFSMSITMSILCFLSTIPINIYRGQKLVEQINNLPANEKQQLPPSEILEYIDFSHFFHILFLILAGMFLISFFKKFLSRKYIILVFLLTSIYQLQSVWPQPPLNTKPLPENTTKTQIENIAHEVGMNPNNIMRGWAEGMFFNSDNAQVIGFFGDEKIIFSDKLLHPKQIGGRKGNMEIPAISDDMLIALAGHELAHYKNNDRFILTMLTVLFPAMLVSILFFILDTQTSIMMNREISSYPLYISVILLAFILHIPIVNTVSQLLEKRADKEGLVLSKKPDAFAKIVLRLNAGKRLNNKKPIIFRTHPLPEDRIYQAMEWKYNNSR